MPAVLGERHGLLQAFLNLAKNSYRAVQDRDLRELRITVTTEGGVAHIRFKDSGPGISTTEHLFEPFHSGWGRRWVGPVRFPRGSEKLRRRSAFGTSNGGTCFRVELQVVD